MKLAEGRTTISDEELELLLAGDSVRLMEKAVKLEQMRTFLERLQAWRCPWEH